MTVHHAARGHDRRTGVRLGQRDASVQFERRVIVDRAVIAQHAAVTVTRVLIETEVRHEDQLVAEIVAERTQRHLRDALRVPGAAAELVLRRRNAKEDDATDADADQLLDLFAQRVDRVLKLAGQRRDLTRLAQPFGDEEWRDEVIRGERRLGDEAPKCWCASKTAGSFGGKHVSSLGQRECRPSS